jgi:V/A-type H+-transporting ATPase subunit I
MDRLEIVFLRTELAEALPFLQEQGLLHIEEVPLAVENAPDFLQRVHLSDEQQTELDALEEMERIFQEIVPLLAAGPERTAVAKQVEAYASMGLEDRLKLARAWSNELRSLTRRRISIQDNIEVLENYALTLLQIEPVLSQNNMVLGKGARAFIMKGDVAKAGEQLEEAIKEIAGAKLVTQSGGRNVLIGVVMCPDSAEDAVTRMFHDLSIAAIENPSGDLQGVPASELIPRIQTTVASERQVLGEIGDRIATYTTAEGANIAGMNMVINDDLSRVRTVGSLAQSQMISVVHGWAPSETVPAFKAEVDKRFPDKAIISTLPVSHEDYPNTPTLLRNHPIFEPFEVLLKIFQPPTYGTTDPTKLVAVFFILFYGFILGDVGYALFVGALAFWLKRKFAHNDIVRSAGTVGLWMAGSSLIFGVLYGEYFGDAGQRIIASMRGVDFHEVHLYAWFHRVHDTNKLLLCGIAFGAVHIPLSLVIGIWQDYKHHHKTHMMEKIGMLSGLTGIGIVAMRFFDIAPFTAAPFLYLMIILFIACAALIIKAMGALGLVQILEVVSLFGNVLSYARLMALGIASAALADLANMFAADASNILLGILIAAPIHLFNIGIGMFSPTLHSLRLNYVEFLPKFYDPEGYNYQPFKKEATW